MKMFNLFEKSVVYIAVLMAFGGADAAQNGRASVMPTMNTTAARMPTIPAVSVTTIGNPAVTAISQTGSLPTVVPQPTPDPDPDPKPECPDGGVKNSAYTVTTCMSDVLQCVNTGALQGGLNALFNEDVRNSIMSGMKVCQAHIDKCITDVRVNCRNVYNETNDVWLDFNSRIIQPEYYNFVLRKTGLTPNQAENTCLLLDRNTYGSSFAAVSDMNAVNTEYNQKVGAYNSADGGTLSKDNPQGVAVNTVGYDGNRGHYARWDAASAECLVRVAAYNKDKLITNSWLFGAVGDDTPAEVWQKAGATFTCNKELFDMSSLLNDTKTAAVISVPGGAIVGGAIGAAAGAGAYNKKHDAYEAAHSAKADPCSDSSYRKELAIAIADSGKARLLQSYAWDNASIDASSGNVTGTQIFDGDYNWNDLADDEDACRDLRRVYEKVALYESVIRQCKSGGYASISDAIKATIKNASSNVAYKYTRDRDGNITYCIASEECDDVSVEDKTQATAYLDECLFIPLQIQDTGAGTGVRCNHENRCLNVHQIEYQVNELKQLSSRVNGLLDEPEDADKGKEIGKGAAIGAATGLGVGALITGITALVEKGNISCKVGDGLNTVSLGKSHSIDSLKDFYVKWNLHLPDTVSPTSAVIDKASWEMGCSQFNSKLSDCSKVQINLKDANGKYTLIQSACKVSGNICIADDVVMASHGIK